MPRTLLDKRNEKHQKLKVLLLGTAQAESKNSVEIGRVLGVHRNTVHRYMSSPEVMPLDKLLRLARSLNIPIDELRECIRY